MDKDEIFKQVHEWITESINNCQVVDVHSHLFPASHGDLLLFGIDNLLTYHYLIAELFIVWSDVKISDFYNLDITKQADIVWQQLFINRTPISEACRGVLTTCKELGLSEEIMKRDLNEIRNFFNEILLQPDGKEIYIKKIFTLAKVEYTVMTNQIFDDIEVNYWEKNVDIELPEQFRTSLRIDKLIFNWEDACKIVTKYEFNENIEGVKEYIRYWYNRIKPEYFMASLPYDFIYDKNIVSNKDNIQKNEEYKLNPLEVIDTIIMPLAIELNLPIAFKFGTQRQLNPELKTAGDSVGVASVESLANLCKTYPKCKFLATFLSRVNQHQLCVVARKFSNLHIYGCWWFLNNPSIIEDITKMRIEMLGFGFTAQHSDARVLEQLLYKWKHSRNIIGGVLSNKYKDLILSGWLPSKEEIERDIKYLLRGSYEDFLIKDLK